MALALGIDTGGTYTDAALVDHDSGAVLASAKSLTTRHDLSIGIAGAVGAVLETIKGNDHAQWTPEEISYVALSTTLATNSLAEHHSGSVALFLVGYDEELMQRYEFEAQLSTKDIVYLRGGHDQFGDEAAPLDIDSARREILARKDRVEAFAISSYFSVRNPDHELRILELVQQLTDKPATCGHELTSRLNAVRRATTVTLNAHLILPLRELIASVKESLRALDVHAPLMVVKGDGSLMRAEWATRRPIETILSGPAASVVGAWHLVGRGDVWVVDMGGTTTDIAALRDGLPILNTEGASVAGWRTMVQAIDVHTTGLGGDSHARFNREGKLLIGPRRVVPLSLLASQHPSILRELRRQSGEISGIVQEGAAEFLVLGRNPGNQLPPHEQELLSHVAKGPLSMDLLTEGSRFTGLTRRYMSNLEGRGLLRRAAFTPTDALHVLGRYDRWNREAAQLAAEILAAQAGMTAEEFCRHIVDQIVDMIATEVIVKVLADEMGGSGEGEVRDANPFLLRAFGHAESSQLGCRLQLRCPLVAIGAPVQAYFPEVAERLHTELVIPPHAEVANAVGAVAGGITQRVHIVINALDDASFVRVHMPDGLHDFEGLAPAVDYARENGTHFVEELAHRAGAEQVETHVVQQDHWSPVLAGQLAKIYLGTDLFFTAVGRPSPTQRPSAQ